MQAGRVALSGSAGTGAGEAPVLVGTRVERAPIAALR